MPKIYTFSLSDVGCDSCTESIENALQKQKTVPIKHISFETTQIPKKLKIEVEMDYGVQFKSGKSLQIAQQIDAVVFDLNGTLTNGRLEVCELHMCKGYSSAQILPYFRRLWRK